MSPDNNLKPGDVYWLVSASGEGHEQLGRRPALIVTDSRLTSLGLTWIVPLTTTDRGWPVHVRVHFDKGVSVAMCEQLRSISVERLGRLAGSIPYDELLDVRSKIRDIVGH